MWVLTGLEAKHRGRVARNLVVVDEELLGSLAVQVHEPRGVRGPTRIGKDRSVERTGQLVHREHVVAPVTDPGGGAADGIEDLFQGRSNGPRRPALTTGASRSGLPGEGIEVLALRLVELQRRRECV